MSRCDRCGLVSAEPFKFCPECGTPAAAAEREERRTVTVLFCDMVGSTELGERLDPESLRRVLTRYFDAVSGVLERHGGTVEKFIGDAVMAVFGAPVVHEDDALRALRAAAELRGALEPLNAELARSYGASLATRVGVNTGQVVTGTDERLATGDAVNVAARLEQSAGADEVLLGATTLADVRHRGGGEPPPASVRDRGAVEPLPALPLKGKREPVEAWRLVAVRDEAVERPASAPMIGGATELRELHGVFDAVSRTRSCRLVTVIGPAGVGKSRLVAEFLAALDGTTTVLKGR